MRRLAAAVAVASAFAVLPAQPAAATICDGGCVTFVKCLLFGGCGGGVVPPPPRVGCYTTPDVTICV